LIERIGLGPYRGLYSLVALLGVVLIAVGGLIDPRNGLF
jgi:hypothetical protein